MKDPFPMLLAASDITLDSLALEAAESAYIESGGQTIGLPVVEAIKAYFVTAAVRARDEKKKNRSAAARSPSTRSRCGSEPRPATPNWKPP